MGGLMSCGEKRYNPAKYSDPESWKLEEMFYKIAKMGKSGRNHIDEYGLRKLYAEHPSWGEKQYYWMAQHNPPKYRIDLKCWQECCNILIYIF